MTRREEHEPDTRIVRDRIHLVDIHCHVVPGVDDGATSLDEALSMLRIAEQDGIETIVATPHVPTTTGERIEPDALRGRVDSLNSAARERGINVKVVPGSELRLEPGLANSLHRGMALSINDGPYVLLELPLVGSWPDYVRPTIYELQLAGYSPILAHVERYASVRRNPDILRELIASGVLMQVNADSICGTSDERNLTTSGALLRSRMVHVIASDAHSTRSRAPRIRSAIDRVAETISSEYADWIASVSEAVVVGNAVVALEPLAQRSRRWWSRLLRSSG